MSQGGQAGTGGGGGSEIFVIDGDAGSVTGPVVTFTANTTAGSSVKFASASSTVMDFDVSDVDNNTLIGKNAGNSSISGSFSTGLGVNALHTLSSGHACTGIGYFALDLNSTGHDNTAIGNQSQDQANTQNFNTSLGSLTLLTPVGDGNVAIGYESLTNGCGAQNIAIGFQSGQSYTTANAEASNIVIGNVGTALDANTIRLGTQGSSTGEQSTCFIAGINGNTLTSPDYVTIDTTTGQLGVTGADTLITVTGNTGGPQSSVAHNFNLVGTGNVSVAGSGGTLTISDSTTQGVVTINGDVGHVTGTTIDFLSKTVGSSTIFFSGNNVSTMTLNLSDSNQNTSCGNNSGNSLATGFNNTTLGYGTLIPDSGSENTAIGSGAGANITGTDSNNIYIGYNVTGTAGDNNKTIIGNGSTATCYIQGIVGNTVSNTEYVTVNSSTGQLGVTNSIPAILPITTVNHAASPYTVLAADQFLAVNVSGGVVTVKLPNAPTTGRVITIKDSTGAAATSNISITTVGGTVTIDGQTTYTMNINYQSISVVFDGTNFEVF